MHYRFEPGMGDLGETSPKFLHAGDFPIVTRSIVVKQGQKLAYGSVVGRIDGDDAQHVLCCKISTPAATAEQPNPQAVAVADGSEKPQGILSEDVDASEGDKEAVIYLTGQFNYNAMNFGEGYADENGVPSQDITDRLRILNIYMEKGVKAHPRT
ncbi:MAG: head decoration protein [Oligoflexales bacterium]